jgi:sporulation protein YlmC with PRC-barrel domain
MQYTLRDYRFNKDIDDIRGSAVYGPDREKLGKIDDVVFDSETGQIRYLVIDTGGWLKSRRFLVPPEEVRPSAENDKDFSIGLSKTEIERFPALDENVLESEDKFKDYEKSYRGPWAQSSVGKPAASDTRRDIPSQSPLSSRFVTFQDEIVHNRAGICERVGSSESRPQPTRKAG